MRYKLTISYDGTDFHGWQVQKDQRTIQGTIEEALNKIFDTGIRIIGAGRTDCGVHALGQVAHINIETQFPTDKIKIALNGNLPLDVRIEAVEETSPDFHARYSAKGKLYRYLITHRYTPFTRHYRWFLEKSLDYESIKKATKLIIGRRDFTPLAGSLEGRSPICEVRRIELTRSDEEIIIQIEGDRFLRQMVRRIVGLLIDVGRGKRTPEEVCLLIEKKKEFSYQIAPAQGLYLVKVSY